MRRFLSGLVVGALIIIIVVCFCWSRCHDGEGGVSDKAHVHRLMTEIFPALAPPKEDRKFRGISGSARFDDRTHLVVHDLHNGEHENQINRNRLAIVETEVVSPYSYLALNIPPDGWRGGRDKVANDLEAACKLSETRGEKEGERVIEYLVAESGRTDKLESGVLLLQPWLGRIFHIRITTDASGSINAKVLPTPNLVLAEVSQPPPPTQAEQYPHSPENYEGMACVRLTDGEKEYGRFLVVLGERGEDTAAGTIYWGEYNANAPDNDKKIEWSETKLTGIRAPYHASTSTKHWRDITGLHIDGDMRLFATAAFDTGEDLPPFQSVAYQLGVICLGTADQDKRCTKYKAPRVVAVEKPEALAASVYYKFESIAGSVGETPSEKALSIGSEDEDLGGTWWPAIRK